jgi:hypothetical protein
VFHNTIRLARQAELPLTEADYLALTRHLGIEPATGSAERRQLAVCRDAVRSVNRARSASSTEDDATTAATSSNRNADIKPA